MSRKRILFLGASNTFGFMLPIEGTYVEMIERRQAERYAIEVQPRRAEAENG